MRSRPRDGRRVSTALSWLWGFGRSRPLRWSARLGLLARAGFYLVLAYLAVQVATGSAADGTRANANGALRAIGSTPLGVTALAAAVCGFAAFALARLSGAIGDESVPRARRFTTAGQAVFYVGLAAVIVRFLLFDRRAGSAQSQDDSTLWLVSQPAGRMLLGGIGLLVVAVTGWQCYLAARGGFTSSLRTHRLGPRRRRAIRVGGGVAIAARAASVAPLGVLLVLAAVHDRPRQAQDPTSC